MHQINEIGSTETVMSSPIEIMASASNMEQPKSSKLNAFDLLRIALSSTLAITIFIIIGHVIRHIAGPSAILSVILAAFLANLVGTFYSELNCTILQAFIGSNKRLMNVQVVSAIEISEQDAINRNTNNENNRNNPPASNIHHNDIIFSDWLLPSYAFAYIFHGEFTAFVIGWNLISEIIVCLALVAKAMVSFFDAIAFDGIEFKLQYAIPMAWSFAGHFDPVALFIPILIGIPLLLLLRQNSILNTMSIALSLLIVVIFLIVGIIHADISNWNRMPESNNSNNVRPTTLAHETGGFFAYGLSGMFQGAAIILFAFIAFDAMIMSRYTNLFGKQHRFANDGCETIENFPTTIPNAILSINAGLFLCLLGMAFALTTIQPYHLLDKDLPILSIVNTFIVENNSSLRIGMRFIILIAGLIAFVGSLYALLHALQRTIQMMLSPSAANASKFKLFEKFGVTNLRTELQKPLNTVQQSPNAQTHQHQQVNGNNNEMDSCTPNNGNERDLVEWHTILTLVGCLIFAFISGLLASLFAIEHLINTLGIGTLLMLYGITIDIIILRYSIYMKHLLHQIPNQNITTKAPNSMSLISILLCVYCILSACLSMFLQAIFHELWPIPNAVSISISVVLVIGLLVIVFIMGIQLKRNALFEFSFLKNPLTPAIALFGCIFLFTSFGVWAWYRIGVWTFIGILSYFVLKRLQNTKHQIESQSGISNDGFISDDEPSKRTSSKTTLKLEDDPSPDGISVQRSNQITTNSIQINDGHESIEMHAIESVEFIVDEIKCKTNVENIMDHQSAYETITENQNVQRGHRSSVNKYDEISNADDIREICIEKREPNGNSYFIEIKPSLNSNHETASNSSSSSNHDKLINEQFSMENVLNANNIEFQYESKPQHSSVHDVHSIDESDSDDEQTVKAVVHVSVETTKPNEIDSNDVKIQTIQPQIDEISMEKTEPNVIKAIESIDTRRQPNFRIGAYEAIPKQKLLFENDDKRAAFKMRLENLFGQNESQPFNRINSSPSRMAHSIRFTNSAPNSLILPNLNEDLMNATNQQRQSNLPLDNDAAIGPSKVPIPPIFNQHLYDTVGRRNKSISYRTALSTPGSANVIDIEVLSMQTKKPNLSRSHAHENLTIIGQNSNNNNVDLIDDSNDLGPEAIKQKLEEIFSRGRTQTNNDDENVTDDMLYQNDGIVLRKIKRIEPFDTIKRQKLIFSNVLRSIRPDSSTNLRRTSSITSTDI